jgi:alkanesulfonate monooxygenase SsuD/methylene tetrahydromethanopterin reductase-like flavin-dependent oxidoreductase (luciferase family)
VKHALFLPPFGELAEPDAMVDIAVRAEAAGWDGLFLWDHVVYREGVTHLADPWIVLAAVAQATSTLRLGTMVTPLPRRRPQVLARQTTTLDRLSGGRLTLGIGVGGDAYGEFGAFGDETDMKLRGEMLDEEVELLRALWSGEVVDHHGPHHTVDSKAFLPTPVQPGGPPLWAAARFGNSKPLRRAAALDGLFPIELGGPDDLRTMLAELATYRTDPEAPYDVCVNLTHGTDPDAWEAAGATWLVTHVGPMRVDRADLTRLASEPPPGWPRDSGWD